MPCKCMQSLDAILGNLELGCIVIFLTFKALIRGLLCTSRLLVSKIRSDYDSRIVWSESEAWTTWGAPWKQRLPRGCCCFTRLPALQLATASLAKQKAFKSSCKATLLQEACHPWWLQLPEQHTVLSGVPPLTLVYIQNECHLMTLQPSSIPKSL